jgi:uncharacterized membrane protein YbhN (UPF0104 family)
MVADAVARAWRLVWLVRGVGERLTFRQAVVVNAIGDGAAALTPGRVGGEPSRLAGLHHAKVPLEAGLVVVSFEVLAAWPVIILFAAALAWRYAPEWIVTVAPPFLAALGALWPWLILVGVASIGVIVLARRSASPWLHRLKKPAIRLSRYWKRMTPGPLLASIPMTLINLTTRTAILPVLAMTVPDPPALGPMLLGSFALLYSQLILPTPAGAGGVELGFLAGAAGQFGPQETALLLWWRFWTTGFGVLFGGFFLIRLFGWSGVRRLWRRGPDPETPEPPPGTAPGVS